MMYSYSFEKVAERLQSQCSGLKLLALGQTIFWDEPMKAILSRMLDRYMPDARMLVGIHDVDYFSKIPSSHPLAGEWAILPHNDGTTRDLWVATGEISCLFGSEVIPTRELLTKHGVPLDMIARKFPGGRSKLIDTTTEAWGWRGIVHAGSAGEVSCAISLRIALPYLRELLSWAFNTTLGLLINPTLQLTADEMLREVEQYSTEHPEATITEMYCEFLPRFYTRLLRYIPSNIDITSASSLFRFNTKTASKPRFNPLRLFLNRETRSECQAAYDITVLDTDIYALDRFPPGAIPFDLVVCGRGRGTICLGENSITIDFDEPVTIPTAVSPETPEELAIIIEQFFGDSAVLIGKAVTLVLMICSEFVFVLHEQASVYVPLCEKMVALMKERNIHLRLCPILRIKYHTWDSLSACAAVFRLPEHLSAAFQRCELTASEFANSWRRVVSEQGEILERVSRISTQEELLSFLAERYGEPWTSRIREWLEASAIIRTVSETTRPLKAESIRLRDLSHQFKQDVQRLEVEKGEHFRRAIKPIKEELDSRELIGDTNSEIEVLRERLKEQMEERRRIEAVIAAKRQEAEQTRFRSLELKRQVSELERSSEVQTARKTLADIEYEAETARLHLVSNALLTSLGLRYTNHRPTAWWFMLVDPDMRWFDQVAETTEFRFEEIDP